MPNLANIDNPYEDQEQEAFVKWLDDNGYPRFRVPNETYTKSHKQRIKNKKLGVSSGVPDIYQYIRKSFGIHRNETQERRCNINKSKEVD